VAELNDLAVLIGQVLNEAKRSNVLLQSILHQLQINAGRAQQVLDRPARSDK
jgi:hypothetical protein